MAKAVRQNTPVQAKRTLPPGHITITDAGERLRKVYGDQASHHLTQAIRLDQAHPWVGPTLDNIPEGQGFLNKFCPVLREYFLHNYRIGSQAGITIGGVVTDSEMRVDYCGNGCMVDPPGGWTWTFPLKEIVVLRKAATSNPKGAGRTAVFDQETVINLAWAYGFEQKRLAKSHKDLPKSLQALWNGLKLAHGSKIPRFSQTKKFLAETWNLMKPLLFDK